MLSKRLLRVINRMDKFPEEFQLKLYKQEMEIAWLTNESGRYYPDTLLAFLNRNLDTINNPNSFWEILKIKPAYYSLHSEGLSKETLRHYHKVLRHYSNFLTGIGLITKNIFNDIPHPKKEFPLPTSLSEEQVDILLEYSIKELKWDKRSKYLQMRGYIIINLLLYCWLRRSELINLKWEHIDSWKLLVLKWKWNKSRYVYFPNKIQKLLEEWREFSQVVNDSKYIVSLENWKQLTEWSISSYFQNISKSVWFRVHPHLLRHTFCSMSIAKWINLFILYNFKCDTQTYQLQIAICIYQIRL